MDEELHYVPHEVVSAIRHLAREASSPYTDGFTACSFKHDLYILKCFIEDEYKRCPDFPEQEKEWEKERLIQILKNLPN